MVSEPSIRGQLKQVIVLCERVLDQLASLKSSAAAVATEELDADSDAATIDSTKLATAMPPTCSTSWSNHDVDALTPVSGAMSSSPLPEGTSVLVPKSATPHAASSSARVVDAALDIVLSTAISCTSMPTKCSTPGLEPNASDGHDADTSLATRAASMIIFVPAGLPTVSARRASAPIKLDTVVHAKCSMECHNEYDVKLLLPATVSVLTPVQVWLPRAVKPKLSTNGMLGAVSGDLAMTTHVTNSRHCSVYCLWDQATRPPPRLPGQTPTTSCLPPGRANPEPPPPPWPSLHEKTPHSSDLHVDNRKQSLNVYNKVSYQVFHEWPPDRAPIEDVGVTIQIVNEMPHDRGEKLSSSGTTGLQQPWPPPSQYFSTILSLSNHCVGTQQEFVLWELNPWLPPVREDRSSRTEVSFLQSQPCFMKNDSGTRLLPPWLSDQAIGVKCMVVEMEPWPPPRRGSRLLFSSVIGTQDEFDAVLKHQSDNSLVVQNSSNQHEWRSPQLLLVYLVMVINNCNASCRESNHGSESSYHDDTALTSSYSITSEAQFSSSSSGNSIYKSFRRDSLPDHSDQTSVSEIATNLKYSHEQDDLKLEIERSRVKLRHLQKLHEFAQNESFDATQKLHKLGIQSIQDEIKLKEIELTEEKVRRLVRRKEREEQEAAKREAEFKQCSAEREATQSNGDQEANENKTGDKIVGCCFDEYNRYTWEEIQASTSSFSVDLMIGRGSYGTVYKAKFHNTIAAVKVLNSFEDCGTQQLQQELEVLGKIRHPHLLLMLGACPEHGCLGHDQCWAQICAYWCFTAIISVEAGGVQFSVGVPALKSQVPCERNHLFLELIKDIMEQLCRASSTSITNGDGLSAGLVLHLKIYQGVLLHIWSCLGRLDMHYRSADAAGKVGNKILQVPWDPGGSMHDLNTSATSSWGQDVIQGGKNVTD